jgi:hypothetical protein
METSDWIIVGIAAGLVLLGGGAQVYGTFFSEVEKEFFYETQMRRAMEDAVEKAPKPETDQFWRVYFAPLKGDAQRKLTRRLHQAFRRLDDGAKFRGPEVDFATEELHRDLKTEYLVDSEAAALKAGTHLGVDLVVWGEAAACRDTEDATEIVFTAKFVEMPVRPSEPFPRLVGTIQVDRTMSKSALSLDYYRLRLSRTSTLFRVLLWFVIAAGLPFLLYPLELKVFQLESNGANLAMLVVMTVLALFSALLLNGFALSVVWVILYLTLIAGCGFYYLALLDTLQEGK